MKNLQLKIFLRILKCRANGKGKIYLSKFNLSNADLRSADLRGADLRDANLHGADLRNADLYGADLSGTDLSGANLSGANLSGSDLRGADLSGTDLSRSDLSGADLSGANISGSDLSGVDLCETNLFRSNLSNTKGIISQREFIEKNFEFCDEGLIAYKAFNLVYRPNPNWIIEENSYIKENVNTNRSDECGCGVNIATIEYMKKNIFNSEYIWKVLVEWKDMIDLTVPYNSDGKIRARRVKLLEKIILFTI